MSARNTAGEIKALTHDEIIASLIALPEGDFSGIPTLTKNHWEALDALYASDPEGVKLATALATSGSKQSRVSMTTFFSYVINDQMEAARAKRRKFIKRDNGFDQLFPPTNPRLQRNEWMFHWNFHNVAQESGDLDSIGTFVERSSEITRSLLPALRTDRDSTYWRGVSALYLSTTQEWATVDLSRHEPFILWAGQHEDINAVIATARERKTIEYDALHDLVEARREYRALGDGTL